MQGGGKCSSVLSSDRTRKKRPRASGAKRPDDVSRSYDGRITCDTRLVVQDPVLNKPTAHTRPHYLRNKSRHPPSYLLRTLAFASQCLLVGGGALGAVSGPSAGAAAGVGVIPAGFTLTPMGGCGCGGGSVSAGTAGIGREDPLQAALLGRIGAVALGTVDDRHQRHKPRSSGRSGDGVHRGGASLSKSSGGSGGVAGSGDDTSGSEDGDGDHHADDEWDGLELPVGLTSAAAPPGASSNPASPSGVSSHLILRLRQIGADLASAQAKQQLGAGRDGRLALGAAGLPCAARGESEGGGLKARAVEAEQELTSVLCLLSSLVSMR